MSYKPCRGSGITIDKYQEKSHQNRVAAAEMIGANEHLSFKSEALKSSLFNLFQCGFQN
jgi:hypothetical protein